MKSSVLLNEGDVFSIPLPNGSYAFGQYLGVFDESTLIRIFKWQSNVIPSVEVFTGAELLFPPIFVGINPPIRNGRWKRIGNLTLVDFKVPRFRQTNWHKKGINTDWSIWSQEEGFKKLGLLPPEFRSLEVKGTWPYSSVEERILTGRNWYADGID